MLNKIKKDNKGFTIIEVLIVLAIAGLILLVVFLAVPALQRNSRNTQLKNGVSSVLAGISEYASNNDGKIPTTISQDGGNVTISSASGTDSVAKVNGGLTVAVSATVDTADINVQFGQKCNDNGNGFAAGTARNYAAIYQIETAGDPATKCTQG
jgi:prepilin-type N-terminal cleavage/methylation domain-containing protein